MDLTSSYSNAANFSARDRQNRSVRSKKFAESLLVLAECGCKNSSSDPSDKVSLEHAFTLIELVVVVAIMSLLIAFLAFNPNIFPYWREEGFLRRLTETLTYLHHQSMADQQFYQVEFSFGDREMTDSFKVGVMAPASATGAGSGFGSSLPTFGSGGSSSGRGSGAQAASAAAVAAAAATGGGMLTHELAARQFPVLGSDFEFAPPPNIPSLADPVEFPPGVKLRAIRTMRGKSSALKEGKAQVLFSPRGFSEFAVLHIELSGGQKVTVLVNPFTGEVETFRGDEFKEFEWSYGSGEFS